MRVGICGYPGSGKSTVFSALAPGAGSAKGGVTYGNIKVPDARIEQLAEIFEPKRNVYAEITFMDVGGGTGRFDGGAFPPDVVQHMRNADVLVHVVRCFESPMVAEGADAGRDVSRFNDELILLDLSILERRGERWRKENKKGPEVGVNDRCVDHLESGEPLRTLDVSQEALDTLVGIQLLSLTPLITLYNHSEETWESASAEQKDIQGDGINGVSLGLCGEMEAEIAQMEPDEQAEFLSDLGLGEPARNEFIRAAYQLLDYISFLTAGPDECRAWPIRKGTIAHKAAGVIHSDIERGFIRAEIYTFNDILEHRTEAALKSLGKIRLEGKSYVMQDGDVVNYRFNV